MAAWAASRCDVAAGIQQRLAAARIGFRGCRELHHGLLTAESISGRDDASENEDGYGGVDNAPAHASALALAVANAQRPEVGSCRIQWSRHHHPCSFRRE